MPFMPFPSLRSGRYVRPSLSLTVLARSDSSARYGRQGAPSANGNLTVIAVVGPMAAGKNYICEQLEREGWASVDADKLVHTAITKLTPQILQAFEQPAAQAGLSIKNSDGSINRRELGRLLFSRPDLLSIQEALVYPEVTRLTQDFIAAHEKSIINATVLYKTPELLSLCQKIIFVTAPLLTRLRRARHRDHLSYRQIFRRFRAQKNLLKEYQKSGIPIEIIHNR